MDRVWSRWVQTEEVHVLGRRYPFNDGINYVQLLLRRQIFRDCTGIPHRHLMVDVFMQGLCSAVPLRQEKAGVSVRL